MDHDAMHRDVGNLKKFRERAEKAIAFIEGLQHAGFNPQGGAVPKLSEDQIAQVREQFSEIIKPVSETIDIKLNSFDDRLKSVEQANTVGNTSLIGGRVSALENRLAQVDGAAEATVSTKDFADLADHVAGLQQAWDTRVVPMVDWFEANREGLEVLLSLDGDPDQADPAPGTSTTGTADLGAAGSADAGGLVAGAQAGSGAAISETGTGGPAPTGPALDAPVAELNNDPSARAETAVAEPTAGTDKV